TRSKRDWSSDVCSSDLALRNFKSFVKLYYCFMRKYHDHLEPGHFYHIYNHAIGSENLFRENKNYSFFLNKWEKYLLSYSDVWAYCLMPNHFHFLLEIKDKTFFPKRINENRFLENQFKRLFSSYTLSFNKVYERRGSLFQKSFKRVKIDSER